MSDGKVVGLNGNIPQGQAVPETVRVLEEMLARAKRGELRSVAIVGVTDQDNCLTVWNSDNQYYTLLGAASWLAYRMNAREGV